MLLVLAFLYLLHYPIHAYPLSNHQDDGIPDLLPTCLCPDQRTTFNITWSCLVTLFACSWVSVHPNIPAPNEPGRNVMLRRLELMFWTIIAPEAVIYWAIRQWEGARYLEKKYRHLGWTMTHSHFFQMGGFMLFKGEEAQFTLLPENFDELLRKGKIQFPKITQAEIQDRSKGDALSKGIVLVQTTWFIIQCIARKAQGLDTTQIELVTLALAAFNGVMYFLWWNKPLDVRCPVPVYILETPIDPVLPSGSSDAETSWTTWFINGWFRFRDAVHSIIVRVRNAVSLSSTTHANKPWIVHWISSCRSPFATLSHLWKRLQDSMMTDSNSRLGGVMHVPSFFAHSRPSAGVYTSDFIPYALGTVFGAIHCIGWFYTFPTGKEEILWRISSLLVATIPGILFLIYGYVILYKLEIADSNAGNLYMLPLLPFTPAPLYILARLGLLVEAVISLRALPPRAYANVEWTSLIPHI